MNGKTIRFVALHVNVIRSFHLLSFVFVFFSLKYTLPALLWSRTIFLIIILCYSRTARIWPLAVLKCQYRCLQGFKRVIWSDAPEYTWYSLHQHHIQLSYLSTDNVNKGGKSLSKNPPLLVACDGLVPVTLVVSSVLTSSWSIHVFLGSFSAQCDPEMVSPATQSVVPGRLLLLLCKPEAGLSGARS